MLFGVCNTGNGHDASSFSFFTRHFGGWTPRYNRGATSVVGSGFVYGEKVTVVAQKDLVAWTREGESTPAGSIQNANARADGKNTMFILDMNAATSAPERILRGGTVAAKLYRFAIYEPVSDGGEEMVREYLPVRVKANGKWTGALLETQTGRLHTNIGGASRVAFGLDDENQSSRTISWPGGSFLIVR